MENIQLVMGTANAYIQQPGLLKEAGEWISKYGKRLFIVTGEKSWASAETRLIESFTKAGLQYEIHKYHGECSYEEVERLESILDSDETDLIIGVGGGKVTDVAKALSNKVNKPFISVPTIAATCAPVANLSIMYSVDGVYLGFPIYMKNTVLVLVDTEIIAASPARYLAAGIGDTIAKWYEARVSSSHGPKSLPTEAGLKMAKLCLDTLMEYSEEAIEQVKKNQTGDALQKVIDSIILISGSVGGFGEKYCRSAAAHAIHNGLTALPASHGAYHGEKVAYGILVQMVMEEKPDSEIRELINLYRNIGLPTKLEDMNIRSPLTESEMKEVARISLLPQGTMNMMPFPVNEQIVIDAISKTEQLHA